MAGFDGWYFHATGLAQGTANLGQDLGLLTGPGGLVSFSAIRLDSWWIEKRWLDDRIAVRVGQFAGQDFYGNAQFGSSFIIELLNYSLGNLGTTLETDNPFAPPAAEIRIAPLEHFYLKWMVMAGDPSPNTSNPTGLVPTFRGSPVIVWRSGSRRVGRLLRRWARILRAGKDIPASISSERPTIPEPSRRRSAQRRSQALCRIDPREARGLDAVFAFDWSSPNINRNGRPKALGQVFAFAMREELVTLDPTIGVEYLPGNSDGFHTWTVEELRQYEHRWPIGHETTPCTRHPALYRHPPQRRSEARQAHGAGRMAPLYRDEEQEQPCAEPAREDAKA